MGHTAYMYESIQFLLNSIFSRPVAFQFIKLQRLEIVASNLGRDF